MITFSTGIPDLTSMIYVEGIGYAQLRRHNENGTVDLYIGNGRVMTVSSSHRWRYTYLAGPTLVYKAQAEA